MNLITCPNGHFYNGDKLQTCPHCANEKIQIREDAARDVDTYIPDTSLTEHYKKAGKRLPIGWLTCIQGHMLGDCFTLLMGENHIGRDTSMDVILFQEPTVSRCNHASLIYDAELHNYTLHAQGNNVYHNNRPVSSGHSVTLSDHDRIQIGDCVLLFVPLCNSNFDWSSSL